jgi:undecaprenyl-diphosphatase
MWKTVRGGVSPDFHTPVADRRWFDGWMRSRAAAICFAAVAAAILLALAALRVGEEPGALSNWQALVLGLVQGATELLPISSSGHLILVPWLADWQYLKEHDEFNQTFDVALHLGTLIAVATYFRHDIARLIAAFLRSVRQRRIEGPDERTAWFIAAATVPAALIGAAGESFIADRLGEPWQIAIFLAAGAVLLWVADRRPQTRHIDDLTLGRSFVVGLAQAVALAPGVSRSGITITAGRFLGLDRDSAARFSFLLLVPITLGAVLFKGLTDVVLGELPPGSAGPFFVGVVASAVSGFVAIVFLLRYVRTHSYDVFVVYRLIAAAIVFLLIVSGARAAGF